MSVSRRRFLQLTGATLCAGAAYPALKVQAESDASSQKLPIPPLLEYRHGRPLFLTLQSTQWAFNGAMASSVWGINGRYLGPTVRVRRGDNVKLIYSNRLDEAVSMCVQGLRVPGILDGGNAWLMAPKKEWAPILPIRQVASTCWYHADTQGQMASQVYRGLAGLWLVDDDNTRDLRLPKHYGVDDLPLILQDNRFNAFGEPKYEPDEGGFLGNILLVNGVQSPFMEVSRGWVRLRLVNAANARRLTLQLSDGRPMQIIAGDAGLLPAPVTVTQFTLAPGERREVLVDLTSGDEVSLTAGETATMIERFKGFFEDSSTLVSSLVLTLKPEGLLPLMTDKLPETLPSDDFGLTNIERTRTLRLGNAKNPGINGALWDANRIDITTRVGAVERWMVSTVTPQPFRLHGAAFRVQSVDGLPPKAEDKGWKDTVWIENEVELIVRFDQPSTAKTPFRYHSGILELADAGCMGQLVVSEG
ncbi:MAG: cell division protein FtsP [Plesiomonas sp.]